MDMFGRNPRALLRELAYIGKKAYLIFNLSHKMGIMSIERDFNCFIRGLEKAGAQIESHYFQPSIAGAKEPKFLERVYCYELYHQLRCTLGDIFPYKLDGEVDKAGNPIVRQRLGAKKPDFIVHVPGRMDRNLVVIEVKRVTVTIQALKNDLEKLQGFLAKAGYHRAIMLIYGDDEEKFKRIRYEIDSLHTKYAERIWLIWHRRPGEKPKIIHKAAKNV